MPTRTLVNFPEQEGGLIVREGVVPYCTRTLSPTALPSDPSQYPGQTE
ncbi:MAG: hypothetical protein KDA80_01880 [Planctomycetaceae bacterium]|nr:hypothetical protein [Planctomycetaceae bacterium]